MWNLNPAHRRKDIKVQILSLFALQSHNIGVTYINITFYFLQHWKKTCIADFLPYISL